MTTPAPQTLISGRTALFARVGRASGTLPGMTAGDPVRFDVPRTEELRPSTGIPS